MQFVQPVTRKAAKRFDSMCAGAVTLASLLPVLAVQIMAIIVGTAYPRSQLVALAHQYQAADSAADR